MTPDFRLVIDGREMSPVLANRLESLLLTDNRGFLADTLELTLSDHDGRLALPPRGARVRVWLGWQGQALEDKGEYIVDELEHAGAPDKLIIRARSADLRAGVITKKERSWADATIGEIVKSIAAQNELTPVVGAEFDGLKIGHIDQTDESDISLLQRLARDHDAIATVKHGRLLFIAAGKATTASGKPLPTVAIVRQAGDGHRFLVADREAYTGVRAWYNDVKAAERKSVIVTAENITPETGTAPDLTVGGVKEAKHVYASKAAAQRRAREEWRRVQQGPNRKGYTGVRIWYWTDKRKSKKQAILAGEDKPPPAPPVTEPSADNVKSLRHVYSSRDNALRAARAEYRRLKRGMATLSFNLAHGRADLSPESPVSVAGFKPEIDSEKWVCVRATHRLDDGGFTTTADLEIRPEELGE